jgi:feruloyl esterase
VYHGWADWLVAPQESINYYENVVESQTAGRESNSYSRGRETQDFFRLFMIPGMSHCGDGPGLNTFDALSPLELWVEKGTAPQKIIARRVSHGVTEITRPICPFPEIVRYTGTGDADEAASFSCTTPGPEGRR